MSRRRGRVGVLGLLAGLALVGLLGCDGKGEGGEQPAKSGEVEAKRGEEPGGAEAPAAEEGEGPAAEEGEGPGAEAGAEPAVETGGVGDEGPGAEDGGGGGEPGVLRIAETTARTVAKGSRAGLKVESGGGQVRVNIESFGWYCTPPPEFTFGRVRQTLVIRPKTPSGALSRCVSPWDVELVLEGVEAGDYEVVVYRQAKGRAVHLRAGLKVE